MSKFLFECIDCKKHYTPDEVKYLCPACSSKQGEMQPLLGVLRCVYDYDRIAKKLDVKKLKRRPDIRFARFAELLPVESTDSIPNLITSSTPLRHSHKLCLDLRIDNLFIKDDTGLPTASFKDRASAMVVGLAKEHCIDTVATASTGNAAVALAGMCASAGLSSVIFVPESAPKAKLTQIAVYGGKLIPIKGNYDQAFELSIKACEEFGWYNRNTAYNPFTVEGKKTAAFEIFVQMNFSAPDWVVVPTGDGVILAGIEKGFADLLACGFIKKVPKLAAIQAAGCCPIVDALNSGSGEIVPNLSPKTIADSISVGVPRAGRWALNAIRETGGAAAAVSDDEIIGAISYLGKSMGVFAEPAAATAFAGLKVLASSKKIRADESVVVLITGNGLKDVPAAAKAVNIPSAVEPSLDAVRGRYPLP